MLQSAAANPALSLSLIFALGMLVGWKLNAFLGAIFVRAMTRLIISGVGRDHMVDLVERGFDKIEQGRRAP
ncbi:hypothetical protein GTZ99_03180 [Novosphingobium sp. FSY-8]|uniref:Uncharacterized protein n=1 Tax=Novosphingobium ovatum TaxID=1908523 RepID=A0ABW9XAJ7_9SPHN|nr:hypothetical protein [Novosphingobium ovatum]NBC35555.1 hypothetical protein [Novosphingobium ovatum]